MDKIATASRPAIVALKKGGMAVAAIMLSAPLFANESFLRDKARGWFWREQPPVVVQPKEDPRPQVQAPSVVVTAQEAELEPPTFSVEWFQKYYKKLFNAAVDNPTPDNVDSWRLATRVMLDKASNLAEVFRERVALDTDLDEHNRYPIANAMRNQMDRALADNKTAALQFIGTRAALWVFLDEECSYCRMQYEIIKNFARESGLLVQYIVRQGRPIFGMGDNEEVLPDLGHSEALGIKLTPAVALVAPPDKIIVLTQGMLAADALGDRILLAAKHEGILSQDRYAEVNPNVAGLLTPSQIKGLGSLDFSGPGFAKLVREMLRENIAQVNAVRMRRMRDVVIN